jgi:hypothetical protein
MLDPRASCFAPLDQSPLNRVCPAICLSAFLAWTWPAYAATVAIVRPPNSSADATETLTRLRGELLSVGLEVAMCDRPLARGLAGADSLTWLEQLAAERGASAVIDTVGDDALVGVDVWVVKAHPRRFEVTRVAVEPGTANPSERLALRAIEALRAGLLEVDLAARQRRADPVAGPPATAALAGEVAKPVSHRERWALEVGAAALMSLDGVGPALLPIVRVNWATRSGLVLQAALAGSATRPAVATTGGSVRLAQQYGVLGGCYRLRPDRRLWPFLALAAGALHTSAEGQSGVTTEGHTVGQWSFLLDGSLGAGLRLYRRYYVTLAAQVHVAAPYVAIHFVDAAVATSGRPNLLLTLTVGAWL